MTSYVFAVSLIGTELVVDATTALLQHHIARMELVTFMVAAASVDAEKGVVVEGNVHCPNFLSIQKKSSQ